MSDFPSLYPRYLLSNQSKECSHQLCPINDGDSDDTPGGDEDLRIYHKNNASKMLTVRKLLNLNNSPKK